MTTDDNDNPAAELNDQELLALFRQNAHLSRLRLVATKAVITAEELAGELGNVSLLDLDKAVQAGRLFRVDVDGNAYFPAFYAAQDIDRTRLERVIKVLSGLGGWSQWQFFTTPKNSLGNITPLQALQRKRMFAAVLRSAAGFAER
ncbi:MAG: hypothetical protein K0M39_12685 [Rhizobium sp.]|nr:hypothetical protein [Rhizobium sp.]